MALDHDGPPTQGMIEVAAAIAREMAAREMVARETALERLLRENLPAFNAKAAALAWPAARPLRTAMRGVKGFRQTVKRFPTSVRARR